MKLKAIATALFLLPLATSATGAEAKGKTVTMTFTPAKSGEWKYGCAMDTMVGGVLKVQ